MNGSLTGDILSWLLTYAVHSTVLLGVAWLITRSRRIAPAAAEIIWKSAMIGGLLTASVQLWLDLRPAGSVSLTEPRAARAVAATTPRLEREAVDASPIVSPAPEAAASTTITTAPLTTDQLAVLVWGTVALVLGCGYAARRLILMGRLGDRERLTDGPLPAMLETLARKASVRIPALTVTTRISSPVALGLREICLPESALTELGAEQQRSMLAHELAHVARRDPLWLIVASGIERVFWFQPLNRVARRELSTAAEFLSDDWAVCRTGSGVALAQCLAQVAEWIQASPLGVPVAGMAEERSLLVTRVARLLENSMPTMPSRRVFALGAFAVLLGTLIVVPTVAGKPAPEPQRVAAEIAQEHRALTPSDSAVVVALIARLKDEDAEVRAAAAEALGKLEDARAIPGLVGALSDASLDVQVHALEALSKFADSGRIPTEAVVRLLASGRSVELSKAAAQLLSELKDRSAAPALRTVLGSPSAELRAIAIQALTEMGDEASAGAIQQRLGDSDAEVRNAALNAMEELHAKIPDATMIALLRDKDADVRQRAVNLAGERSMVSAVSTIVAMFDDANADVRVAAVEALSNIADDSARAGLRKALSSPDAKVRRAAVEALGERRD